MAIDYTEPLGQVRLLITDTAEEPTEQLFTDEQIKAFLAMRGDNVNRAAAKALLVIAASEALVSKKIRTQDLSTDGPAVSAELRALAKVLTDEADAADASATEGYFDVIPLYPAPGPEGVECRW